MADDKKTEMVIKLSYVEWNRWKYYSQMCVQKQLPSLISHKRAFVTKWEQFIC